MKAEPTMMVDDVKSRLETFKPLSTPEIDGETFP